MSKQQTILSELYIGLGIINKWNPLCIQNICAEHVESFVKEYVKRHDQKCKSLLSLDSAAESIRMYLMNYPNQCSSLDGVVHKAWSYADMPWSVDLLQMSEKKLTA